MADRPRILRRASLQAALAGLVLLCQACTAFGPWSGSVPPPDEYAGSELSILAGHLETMRALAGSEHAEQMRIFEETSRAAQTVRTSSRRLRLALAMSVPGHPASNSAESYRLLTDLLQSPDALLESERELARVQLTGLQQRMILEAEVARLDEALTRPASPTRPPAAPAPGPEIRQRLAELEAQNARLATELEQARSKLEAVMAIERDVERRDGNGGNPR